MTEVIFFLIEIKAILTLETVEKHRTCFYLIKFYDICKNHNYILDLYAVFFIFTVDIIMITMYQSE